MNLYDKIEQQREIPKQRFRCHHVIAGFLVVARIDLGKATVDVCQGCFDGKMFMDFVDDEPVVKPHTDML